MRLVSVKEKFHSDDSAATVFFPVGPAGKGEEAHCPGPVQAVSALPVLRDIWDPNPWHPALGLGVTGICPVLRGGQPNLSRKIEAGVEKSKGSTGQPWTHSWLRP